MNRYSRLAFDHWLRHRPGALASMADPEGYFERLGEMVETQVIEARDRLLGSRRPAEDLESYRLRAYRARRQAEETVLAELVWAEPEAATAGEGDDDEILAAYHRRLDLGEEILRGLGDLADQAPGGRPPA
ncbi:MAG: hypothetical protein ACLGIO_00775 [Acidimicrobiia bacterium]